MHAYWCVCGLSPIESPSVRAGLCFVTSCVFNNWPKLRTWALRWVAWWKGACCLTKDARAAAWPAGGRALAPVGSASEGSVGSFNLIGLVPALGRAHCLADSEGGDPQRPSEKPSGASSGAGWTGHTRQGSALDLGPAPLSLGLPFLLFLRDSLCCAVFQLHSNIIIIGGLLM